jgi:hypothetical protein
VSLPRWLGERGERRGGRASYWLNTNPSEHVAGLAAAGMRVDYHLAGLANPPHHLTPFLWRQDVSGHSTPSSAPSEADDDRIGSGFVDLLEQPLETFDDDRFVELFEEIQIAEDQMSGMLVRPACERPEVGNCVREGQPSCQEAIAEL